jgi:hypothetical protein
MQLSERWVIVTVPPETPVTTPVQELIVATAGLLLLQVHPVEQLFNVVVAPTQICVDPVIAHPQQ